MNAGWAIARSDGDLAMDFACLWGLEPYWIWAYAMSPLVAATVTWHLLPLANGLDPHFAPELAVAGVVVYVTDVDGAVAVVTPLQLPAMFRLVLVVVVVAPAV